MAVGEIHRLEQRAESFLLAEQDGAEVPGWTDSVDAGGGKVGDINAWFFDRVQIIPDFDRSAADAPVGVRLLEVRFAKNIPYWSSLSSVIAMIFGRA
jgi:hypothetical protein